MTATQDVNEIDGVDLGVARSDIPSDVHGDIPSDVRSSGTDAEVELLRAEVDRLHTLLVTENVGLAVGILMVHRRCGAREALAGLVELALSSGRTMAQEADGLVARYDPQAPGAVDVPRQPPTTA